VRRVAPARPRDYIRREPAHHPTARFHARASLLMLTTTSGPGSSARAIDPMAARRGRLAMAFQEAFTAAVRLRANRQFASDPVAFRAQIKQLLGDADREARQAGYDPAHARLAIYAYVAFLDESVLNSGQPSFAGWARQPLQEELFGDFMAGQTFFTYLDELLARVDSEELADLLEVFLLCMLLGFRGRYGAGEDGGLRTRIQTTQEKIARVRGPSQTIAPNSALPVGDGLPARRDPWLRRLAAVAILAVAFGVLLLVVFHLSLRGQVEEVRSAAAELVS
jgi:type VI secretion system protein ImpK